MKLVLTGEQEALRESVRRLLAERSPMSRVRELTVDAAGAPGYDTDLWTRLADLGTVGLVVDEKHGGAGAGYVELCVVLEELGRALAPVPYVASATLAATACVQLDGADELTEAVAGGTLITTVITPETASGTPRATRDGGSWRLDGVADLVLDGQYADHIIVGTDDGFFLVGTDPDTDPDTDRDTAATGLSRTPLTSADPTRGFARLEFSATPARDLTCDDPARLRRHLADVAALALAAEQVGGMTRCVEMTVEYAKIRMQFGRPIGSFQAVKHALADMYAEAEQATAALRYAAWAADSRPEEFPVAASVAKAACSDAYAQIAAQTIQLHGGIGFTWEHDAHLYFKRAHVTHALFGDPAHHRELLVGRLGL